MFNFLFCSLAGYFMAHCAHITAANESLFIFHYIFIAASFAFFALVMATAWGRE